MAEGIEKRIISKGQVRYRATVSQVVGGERKREHKTFERLDDAKAWRAQRVTRRNDGFRVSSGTQTVRDAWHEIANGLEAGTIRTRGGRAYRASTVRQYAGSMKLWLPLIGTWPIGQVALRDLQVLADELAERFDGATMRNSVKPLRLIFTRAMRVGQLGANPLTGISLPSAEGRRERIATRDEAAALIAAIPEPLERAAWGCAFYAGLRLGEIRALRWRDVDFDRGTIRVSHSLDQLARLESNLQPPKSRAGLRTVPIVERLYALLRALDPTAEGFVFGRENGRYAMSAENLRRRALIAWGVAELQPITPHEARHTFASLLIATGANVKAISTVMGHASSAITLDRYGHLLPGAEVEIGARLDAYLA